MSPKWRLVLGKDGRDGVPAAVLGTNRSGRTQRGRKLKAKGSHQSLKKRRHSGGKNPLRERVKRERVDNDWAHLRSRRKASACEDTIIASQSGRTSRTRTGKAIGRPGRTRSSWMGKTVPLRTNRFKNRLMKYGKV